MKWILLVMIINQTADSGSSAVAVPFENKELCETASIQVKNDDAKHNFRVQSIITECLQVKP